MSVERLSIILFFRESLVRLLRRVTVYLSQAPMPRSGCGSHARLNCYLLIMPIVKFIALSSHDYIISSTICCVNPFQSSTNLKMHICVYTYIIHTHIRTNIYIHTQTCTYTRMNASCMHTCKTTWMHATCTEMGYINYLT